MSEFYKYTLNRVFDSIIIIDISLLFLYFNSQLNSDELIGCAIVFFIVFNTLGLIHWHKSKKEKEVK